MRASEAKRVVEDEFYGLMDDDDGGREERKGKRRKGRNRKMVDNI